MGLLSVPEFVGCLFAVNFTTTCFLGWALRFVYQTAKAVIERSPNARNEDTLLFPCIFERYCNCNSTLQFTMGATVATVVVFFLNALFSLFGDIFYLSLCNGCEKNDERPAIVSMLYGTAALWMATGYVLMLVTHFERLRLTFSSSAMALPKWAPNVLYIILFIGFAVLPPAIYWENQYQNPIVSLVCFNTILALYLGSIVALVVTFFRKTLAIARNAQHGENMTKAAVRISVSVTVSLLSSTLSAVLWTVFLIICPHCLVWRWLGNSILSLDICINSFCLMCTFGKAQNYYLRVFGIFDRWFLAYVSPEKMPEREPRVLEMSTSVPKTHLKSVASLTGIRSQELSHSAVSQ